VQFHVIESIQHDTPDTGQFSANTAGEVLFLTSRSASIQHNTPNPVQFAADATGEVLFCTP